MCKAAGKLTMSAKNNPLDEMKMAMLGFEPGYTDKDTTELINKIKKKINDLNNSGTIIPESTIKVIYQKLCSDF